MLGLALSMIEEAFQADVLATLEATTRSPDVAKVRAANTSQPLCRFQAGEFLVELPH